MKQVVLLFCLVFVIASCSRNTSSSLEVLLTDNPANADAVYIEITGVSVEISQSGERFWYDLETNEGVYDLLTLQDNITTILANSAELPEGHLHQIRIMPGKDNSLVIGGDTMNIEIPVSTREGFSIFVGKNISASNNYSVTIDFDAETSLQQAGRNTYLLWPDIKLRAWSYK